MYLNKNHCQAQWDVSTGKDICCEAWQLEFSPGTHTVEGENRFLEVVFWSSYVPRGVHEPTPPIDR